MVFGYGSPSRLPQVENRKEYGKQKGTGYGNMVGKSAKPLLAQLLLQFLIKKQCA